MTSPTPSRDRTPNAQPGDGAPRRRELDWIRFVAEKSARAMPADGGESGTLALGIGDDCAILRPAVGEDIVVTTDFCLEGRHFRRDWHTPESAGHRTLARGLSDLAAMGARPLAAFLSLALPGAATPGDPAGEAGTDAWSERFVEGLLRLAQRFGVPLAGGDTAQSPSAHLLADVVLMGAVPAGTALRRSGARPGDYIFVTGALGGSAAELEALRSGTHAAGAEAFRGDPQAHPQLFPEPRLAAGAALRALGLATACIDLSDGLSTDLTHLCHASGVCAHINLAALPASPWLRGLAETEREGLLLHGGEDYELLFTVAPDAAVPAALEGLSLTRIGVLSGAEDIAAGQGQAGRAGRIFLSRPGQHEKPLLPGGWEHLR